MCCLLSDVPLRCGRGRSRASPFYAVLREETLLTFVEENEFL
jgi:hypothetical protein